MRDIIFKNLEHLVNNINSKITQFIPYAGCQGEGPLVFTFTLLRIKNQVQITVQNIMFKNLEHEVNKINSKNSKFTPYAGYQDRDP